MAQRPKPQPTEEAQQAPAPDPRTTSDAELSDRPFRGELVGFRPSSRAGLSAARLSTAERIRRYLEELRKSQDRQDDEGSES